MGNFDCGLMVVRMPGPGGGDVVAEPQNGSVAVAPTGAVSVLKIAKQAAAYALSTNEPTIAIPRSRDGALPC